MKKALISSLESVSYISSWAPIGKNFAPVVTMIPNALRVAETAAEEFPVYHTLFWVDCADDVVTDQYYWDSVQQLVIVKPQDAPYPVVPQPTSEGTQDL